MPFHLGKVQLHSMYYIIMTLLYVLYQHLFSGGGKGIRGRKTERGKKASKELVLVTDTPYKN